MFFSTSERKGVIVLLILITAIIVIPRHIRPESQPLYLLPIPISSVDDSLFLPKDSVKPPTTFPSTKSPKLSFPVDLNTTDSITLVKIKGIGPYYASRIIRYRQRLGGYYAVNQLKELKMTYFNVDSSAHLFRVNPDFIQKSDLDTMSFKAVLRHPYLEYEDVQMIFNAKKKYRHISYDTLEQNKVLARHKLKKIKAYFK